MAKKKRKKPPPRLARPAAWFRESVQMERRYEALGADNMARAQAEKRAIYKGKLIDDIKLLRQYARGFEARDGFNLNDVARIHPSKLKKLEKYAPILKQEIAEKHVTYSPRTRATKKAVEKYTGQNYLPGRRKYVVITPHPEAVSIRAKGKKIKTLEVTEKYPGGRITERTFFLSDYRKKPALTFEQIIRTTKKMLPDMPDAQYVIVTSTHGNIGINISKSKILEVLNDQYMVYDKIDTGRDNRGLAGVVLGFRLTAMTADGARREYRERLTRRQQAEAFRSKQRSARRRAALRRFGR